MEPGRYETQGKIGEGGMGVVARVRDRYLEREVAVKTLLPGLRDDPESYQRFVREARAAGQFEHPNIPPVHELGKGPDGTPYFTMRLVQGETLSKIIARLKEGDAATHAVYTFTRRLQIVQQVCEALEYAHHRGYLHRDIKPDNIMIGPGGEVQVMDWGLALPLKVAGEEPGVGSSRLTHSGGFVGTPAYAAPEQIAGEPASLSPSCDIYSVGILLYELCTLELPFSGKNVQETLAAVLSKKPRAPEHYVQPIQGRVPREISGLILRAISRAPEDRPASALELKQDLQLIIEGVAPVVCPHTAYKRGLNRLQRFMDNHHSAPVILLIYLWTVLPLLLGGWIVYQHFVAPR